MADDPRSSPSNYPPSPPSRYPPSMGPGARPQRPNEGEDPRTNLMQVMQARSKYKVSVEQETLSLSYELNDAPRLYRLSFDSIPLQGLSKWWLYGGEQRARRAGILAIDIIRGSENMVQRPVTQQEAESLTYWSSNRLLYGSYATVVGAALGLYIGRRGHAKMKFPIMPAKPLQSYNQFPLERVPLLTGRRAQIAWQFCRYTIWFQLAYLVTTPFVSTVGAFRVAGGMANDSRTQGLVHALKERGKGDMNPADFPQQRQLPSGAGARGQDQDAGQGVQSDFQSDSRDLERGQMAEREESARQERSYRDGASDAGTLSDSAVRDRESKEQYDQYSATPQPQRQVQSSRPSTSADSDPFFYDDASPTAGTEPSNSSRSTSTASSGGSVWDRIRGGQSQSRSPSPASSQSSRAVEARSASIAEQEAESNERNAYGNEARFHSSKDGRDREQAQRDFDQMLERERQQSGSDEYDRGMQAVEQGEESRGSGGGGGSVWESRRRS